MEVTLFIWSYCRDMKKSSLNAGTLNRGYTVRGVTGHKNTIKYFKMNTSQPARLQYKLHQYGTQL
jgi:hypothetical protein